MIQVLPPHITLLTKISIFTYQAFKQLGEDDLLTFKTLCLKAEIVVDISSLFLFQPLIDVLLKD